MVEERKNDLGVGEEFESFIPSLRKKPPFVVEDTFQTSTLAELPVRQPGLLAAWLSQARQALPPATSTGLACLHSGVPGERTRW